MYLIGKNKFIDYLPWKFSTKSGTKRKIVKSLQRKVQQQKYNAIKRHHTELEELLQGITVEETREQRTNKSD